MSSKHKIVGSELAIEILNGSADMVTTVLEGLRRGLVHTHRIEQFTRDEATGEIPTRVGLRLVDIHMSDGELRRTSATRQSRVRRMDVQCRLLDDLGVPNGVKAIDIALARHWSEDLRSVFGDHDSPATIKRWRIERARQPRHGGTADRDRRYMQAEVCRVRYAFAVRTVSTGRTAAEGYSAALKEVAMINAGAHPDHPKPAVMLERFSYATFARDCQAVAQRMGGRSAWQRRRR